MDGSRTIPAAQYVRMSTEHQRYSPENQMAANAAYALEHGYAIVETFSDHGISGLTFEKRAGLKALLQAVLDGQGRFRTILVYDVSRWGRFQDPDEAAHYEFLCRSAGVRVCYTTEPFVDDGSVASSLVKHLKRAMAAEFSRELSDKVSRTQRGLASKGFWMGGPVGYGLRRLAITPEGEVRTRLEPRQRGALRGDRVVLTPGPPEEVRTVRRIFKMFALQQIPIRLIAARLNAEGVHASYGSRWTGVRLRRLLRNENYIGTMVFGRRRHHLGSGVSQPPSEWIRTTGCFQPIVGRALFATAQRCFRTNRPYATNEVLLDQLRAAAARHGRLTAQILNADPESHSAGVYRQRFGNLSTAYAIVGYQMDAQQLATSVAAFRDKPHLHRGRYKKVPDDVVLAKLAGVLKAEGRLSKERIEQIPGIPHSNALTCRFGGLINLYRMLGYEPDERQLRGMRTGRVRRVLAPSRADANRPPACDRN